MAIIRNVADINGDGLITSDDFRLILVVCCLKLTRLGMGELTLQEKKEMRRNRRKEVLAGATDSALVAYVLHFLESPAWHL